MAKAADKWPSTELSRAQQDTRVAEAHGLIDRSDLQQAAGLLQSVLQANPSHVQARIEMARYYMSAGYDGSQVDGRMLDLASLELTRALAVEPGNANVQVLFGKLHENRGRYQESLASLEKAKALGTRNPWLHVNFANTYAALGRWKESAESLRTLDRERPRLDPVDNRMQLSIDRMWLVIHGLEQDVTGMAADNQRLRSRATRPAEMRLEHARFLLAWRNDADAAIAEATAALESLPRGYPRDALALAQYVKWDQLRESDPARAKDYLEAAQSGFPDRASVIRSAVRGLGKSPVLQHLVLALVAEGASLDAHGGDGYTPLLCAITCAAPESVGWLLDHGAGVDVRQAYDQSTPLLWASVKNDIPSLVLLARRGADVNASNRAGRTALWFAAYNGNEAMVKTLLGLGAAVDQAGGDHDTPLIQAAKSGLTPIVRLLLDAGADPAIRLGTEDAEAIAQASGHAETAMLIRSRLKK